MEYPDETVAFLGSARVRVRTRLHSWNSSCATFTSPLWEIPLACAYLSKDSHSHALAAFHPNHTSLLPGTGIMNSKLGSTVTKRRVSLGELGIRPLLLRLSGDKVEVSQLPR